MKNKITKKGNGCRVRRSLFRILAVMMVFSTVPYVYGADAGGAGSAAGSRAEETGGITVSAESNETEAAVMEDSSVGPDTHLYYKSVGSPYGSGDLLYSSLKITGSAMTEEQVINVSELEQVYSADILKLSAGLTDRSGRTRQGLDFFRFTELCGLDPDAPDDYILSFYKRLSTQPSCSCTLGELKASKALIAVSSEGLPLVRKKDSPGYSEEAGNDGGPILLCKGQEVLVTDLAKILISRPGETEDPYYGLHIREPLQYMQSTVFTVNYIDKNQYSDEEENAAPFRSFSFTMKEIEDLMVKRPDEVRGSYFGISGNESTKDSLGLGGFCDYYEGLDLGWFLREQTGLRKGEGSAVFYGRDQDRYGVVKDLLYFFAGKRYGDYYLEIDNDTLVRDTAPILAVSKNGYPLLPRHDHDMEGSVDYNLFNHRITAEGFESKIGIVHNVSGPFVAGLANLDGVYGGYRNETNGDCVRIDLFVDPSDYDDDGRQHEFADVPSDSWFAGSVSFLFSEGIVNGVSESSFAPHEKVSRAQFVKMIAVWSGADLSNRENSFSDVSPDSWAAPYIAWAAGEGIVNGTGEGRFSPDDPISREQMAVIIDRCIDQFGISMSRTSAARTFTDQEKISGYALDQVLDLSEYEIINGRDDGSFDPVSSASRAESAAVMARLIEKSI